MALKRPGIVSASTVGASVALKTSAVPTTLFKPSGFKTEIIVTFILAGITLGFIFK